MSGKGLNAFKAGSTACELCETAMAKPVRRNVASGDDKGRPFLDESIQPVPRDGASSVAEVFKDRILRTRRGVTPQFFKRRLGFLGKIHPPYLAAFTQHVKIPAPLPVDHIHPFERYRFSARSPVMNKTRKRTISRNGAPTSSMPAKRRSSSSRPRLCDRCPGKDPLPSLRFVSKKRRG